MAIPEQNDQKDPGATASSTQPIHTLELSCSLLPKFDSANPDRLRQAFTSAPPCRLQQAWLDNVEEQFAAATVRCGWRDNSFMVFAELIDADIFNIATELNQRLWELGDTFEIFLRPEKTEGYVEFQVTPDNQRLQLRYPNRRAVESARRSGDLRDFLIWDDTFRSRTWKTEGTWHVFAEIPAASVYGHSEPLQNSRWRFSFCRYDYTRGMKEPVISSTSPHAQPDFHRTHEWGLMTFVGGSQTRQI